MARSIPWFPRRRSVFTARQRDNLIGCCGCIVVVPVLFVLMSCGGMLGFVARHGTGEPSPADARDGAVEPVRKIVEHEPTAKPTTTEPTVVSTERTTTRGTVEHEPIPTVEPVPVTTAVPVPEITSPAAALAKIRSAERNLREKKAQSKLRVAKSFLRLKNVAAAVAELEAVVAEFGDTEAAAEARELLKGQAGK